LDYEEVIFLSLDGWKLSGWFIPSQNGAIVILTHGMGGNRLDMTSAASILAERGFGLLLYDLRCHGRSAGNLGTWGWQEIYDLLGAVEYLHSRAEIESIKIGAMGFSLGGQITIRAAAINDSIKAVIAEDPAAAVLTDHPMPSGYSFRKLFNYPGLWLVYTLQSAISGVPQPSGVMESIGKIAPRPLLLISSGRGGGPDTIRTYYDNAHEPKELWEVPDTGHGWISTVKPDEYQEKIITFFNRVFLEDELIEYT
jgi:pimeloyl-ACP methyl ester carboxylesterase